MHNTVKDLQPCSTKLRKSNKAHTIQVPMVNFIAEPIKEISFVSVPHTYTIHAPAGTVEITVPSRYVIFTFNNDKQFCTKHKDEIFRWYRGLK